MELTMMPEVLFYINGPVSLPAPLSREEEEETLPCYSSVRKPPGSG